VSTPLRPPGFQARPAIAQWFVNVPGAGKRGRHATSTPAPAPVIVPVTPEPAQEPPELAPLEPLEPACERAIRAELVEEDGGFLLGVYRADESGETVFCPDSAALCDLPAINRVLRDHGMCIDAAPGFWNKHAIPSMLESIDYRSGLGFGEVFGSFDPETSSTKKAGLGVSGK
jgi:hypothetical protein